jgi:integrase/recombinase XerD
MTDDEIQAFFKECDSYVLRHKALGRPYVYPALYRFLYCCGVRGAEARNLNYKNVHLDKEYVDILQKKP